MITQQSLDWEVKVKNRHNDLAQVYTDDTIDINDCIVVYRKFDNIKPPSWLIIKLRYAENKRTFHKYRDFKEYMLDIYKNDK